MRKLFIAGVLVLAVLVVGGSAIYTVREWEQVIVVEFGKIVGQAVSDPGLHFKAPFMQEVRRFDKRWLEWEGHPNQIPTRDKKYIWVDAYARWRIINPVMFFQRLRDEAGAQTRLDDIIDGEIRNVIASHDLIEIVRTGSREFERVEEESDLDSVEEEFHISFGRDKLTHLVLEKASAVMPEYGIELADVRIRRLNYVDTVQAKVFERMISERQRIASRFRSEGKGKSAEIRGKLERELKVIESEGYRKAEEIRGRGDAEAAAIYADAYNKDANLYQFLKTLESYERTIGNSDTTLVLSTSSDLLKYLRSER